MKKVFAITLFIGVLLQTLGQLLVVADYYINKDYIAKNLCENRDKPQMHCDGKCCLKKKLAKQGKEQAPTSRTQRDETVNLFFSNNKIVLANYSPASLRQRFFSVNELGTASYHHTVFHPPAA